jgi:hypothetical protein
MVNSLRVLLEQSSTINLISDPIHVRTHTRLCVSLPSSWDTQQSGCAIFYQVFAVQRQLLGGQLSVGICVPLGCPQHPVLPVTVLLVQLGGRHALDRKARPCQHLLESLLSPACNVTVAALARSFGCDARPDYHITATCTRAAACAAVSRPHQSKQLARQLHICCWHLDDPVEFHEKCQTLQW